MNIVKGQLIAGVPAIQVRALLNHTPYSFPLESLCIDKKRIGKKLVKEGFVEKCPKEECVMDAEYRLSESGRRLALASAMKRMSCAEAKKHLDSFLSRVQEVNANPKLAMRVIFIVIFGSMAEGREDVGDVDIAYCLSIKGNTDAEAQELQKAKEAECRRSKLIEKLYWHSEEVNLYLKKRNPRLSFHPFSVDAKAICSTAKIIFDEPAPEPTQQAGKANAEVATIKAQITAAQIRGRKR
jgi:predicted nucleotidyltransferase